MRLAERYLIEDPDSLALRGVSSAIDGATEAPVLVKELTLGRLSDWKDLELFQREARALSQLSHEGVPDVVDSFDGGDEGEPRFYLVQSWVEGLSVAEAIEGGVYPDEKALLELAEEVLGILAYLQSFSPPVVHRDVKPANLIRRPSGGYVLVDFGSVAVRLEGTTGGSTVVGTSGYMAPEQLLGRAVPASDLYGLGATLVHALTGVHPADLPIERMKLKWRERARFGSDRFHSWVDRLVEPLVANRPSNATEALRTLGGGSAMVGGRTSDRVMAVRPTDTEVKLHRTGGRLRITFPRERTGSVVSAVVFVLMGLLLPLVLVAAALGVGELKTALLLAGGFVAVDIVIGAIFLLGRKNPRPVLELDAERGFRLRCRESDFSYRSGKLEEVVGPDVGYGARSHCFDLATKVRTYELSNACSADEQKWLADEIARFLHDHR